jgi:TfoX/Sxy family transcriptional regulator of competence genes
MAYDEELAERIRHQLAGEPGVTERRMFGGLAFLVDGHMTVAAIGRGGLMVRTDEASAASLVDGDLVVPMEMRGGPVRGWLQLSAPAVAADDGLETWVERALAHVRTLPPKDRAAVRGRAQRPPRRAAPRG